MMARVQVISFLVIFAAVCFYYAASIAGHYSPTPQLLSSNIDLLAATTHDLQALLSNGTVTSVQLVSEYQRRMQRDNRAGLWLNAIIDTAPKEALRVAKERDDERKAGKNLGSLHGIPFVVKARICPSARTSPLTFYRTVWLRSLLWASGPLMVLMLFNILRHPHLHLLSPKRNRLGPSRSGKQICR